jgi:hypothetical protein
MTRGVGELALREKQAVTLEDISRRRTGSEYLPGARLPAIGAITPCLSTRQGSHDPGEEAGIHRERRMHKKPVFAGTRADKTLD